MMKLEVGKCYLTRDGKRVGPMRETFGGTTSSKGYRTLDPHIGAIYGDSITHLRAMQILSGLARKGFAADNIVLGIGSFTYQYVTRDSLGLAMKATYGEINGQPVSIFKEPKTDSGTKISARGLLRVDYDETGKLTLYQDQTHEQEKQGLLTDVFVDGELRKETTLAEIRERMQSSTE